MRSTHLRAFKLKIGLDPRDTLTFGMDNPSGLGIKFSLAFFDGAESSSIPNTVEVFNCDTKFYKNAKSYIGKTLSLAAGFDKSVFAIKAGYTKFNLSNLYSGKITSVIPNYSSFTDPSVIFAVSGSYTSYTDKTFKALELNGPSLSAYKIVNWLEQYKAPGVVIKPSTEMLTLHTLSTSTVTISASTMTEALDKLESFGINSSLSKNTITLGYKAPGMLGGALQYLQAFAAKKLIAEELVSQPQIINRVTSQVTTALRGDINLGDYVSLPGNLLSSLGNTDFSSVNVLSSNLAVFAGGTFQVTGVNHLGDSRNPSPESWVTSLKLLAKVGAV